MALQVRKLVADRDARELETPMNEKPAAGVAEMVLIADEPISDIHNFSCNKSPYRE